MTFAIWRPDHRGIMTLWTDERQIAAVSPIYEDEKTSWYWYAYLGTASGFCDTLEQAQAEAERSTSTGQVH
jgi:hypothetical protein